MNNFLNANRTLMENWVSNGGVLYLNSAGWTTSVVYGFGGVQAVLYPTSANGNAVNPAHPIFNGPFLPAGTAFTGGSLAHDHIVGGSTSPIMTGQAGVLLSETAWGSGWVIFGGLTASNFWSPIPNNANLMANILAYLDGKQASADSTAPTVDSFAATSPSTSLDIPITAFTASDDTGVTGYMITESATPPAAGDAGWSGTAPATYTVAADGTYTLYPWAKDAVGNVSAVYGSPVTVQVTTAPAAFNKASPANGATGVSTSPTLSWNASSGQTDYEYCIDPNLNSACDSGGVWTSTSNDTSAALSGLAYANSYEWQVRAVNASGNTEADSGTWWTFVTIVSPPAAFGKTGPASGTISQSTTITMSWAASTGATGYEYCLDQVAGSTCDTSWVSLGNVLTVNQSGLPANSTFYWQVRAVNANPSTTEADGGTWWTYITDNTAPVLSLPGNMTVEAAGPAGAVVTFSATATDETSPANPVVAG
jgi:hypothetical protein